MHIISFCGDGDLLSQWKYYGQNSGVAIEFDFSNIKCLHLYNKNKLEEKSQGYALLHKVAYKTRDKTSLLDNICKNIFYLENNESSSFSQVMKSDNKTGKKTVNSIFVPFCKNENYAEEKESRIVIPVDLNREKNMFNYIVSASGIPKPAINVTFKSKNKKGNIIKSIIVGPGQNQNLVFNSLIHIFDRINYRFHEEDDLYVYNKKTKGLIKYNAGKVGNNLNRFCDLNGEQRVEIVRCDDRKFRKAYKCQNGIVIMKSSIPFRG